MTIKHILYENEGFRANNWLWLAHKGMAADIKYQSRYSLLCAAGLHETAEMIYGDEYRNDNTLSRY